jgi:hypothetical protein
MLHGIMTVDIPGWRWIVAHRRALVGFGAALFLVSGFLELSEDVAAGDEEPALARTDRTVLVAVASGRCPWLTTVALDLTALGSPLVLAMFAFLLAWAFAHFGLRRSSGVLAVAAASGGVWTVLLKRFFDRARPDVVPRLVEVSGLSYPSGPLAGRRRGVRDGGAPPRGPRAEPWREGRDGAPRRRPRPRHRGVPRVPRGPLPHRRARWARVGTAWALLLLATSASLPPAAAPA